MRTQTNDTSSTYPLIQSESNYSNTPMETAADPAVRVAAMTVASYYNENRDKYEVESEDPEENVTPTLASKMLDYLDSSVTPVVNSFKNISENFKEEYSFLPWLQKMYNIYPQVVKAYESGRKNISSITNDGTALGYLNMIYGYIDETLDLLASFTDIIFADNRDAIRQMMCCMLFYFSEDLSFNDSIGQDAAEKIDEVIKGIEAVEETLNAVESTLNSGIGLVNSISKMIGNILKAVLQTAVYGVVAVLAKQYGDLIDKLQPKLNFKICGKSIIDYLDFSGKISYEVAAIVETTLREKINGLKNEARNIEQNRLILGENLKQFGLGTTELTDLAVSMPLNYIKDVPLPKQFEETEEMKNAICNSCIPLYDLVGKSVNIGVTSIVSWLATLTKQLMTLVPEIPSIPKAKFRVLATIKTVKNLLEKIKSAFPMSAELESCRKEIRSVIEIGELPEEDIVNPNPDPSDVGNSLGRRGYVNMIAKLPEDFIDYIKEKEEERPWLPIKPNDIFDAIEEDKSKDDNPEFDIPEKVFDDVLKTPRTIIRQIMEVQYDIIMKTRDRVSYIDEEEPYIEVSVEPITKMIRISKDGESVVTNIPSSGVTPDVVSSIINLDPQTLKAIASLTPEQIKSLKKSDGNLGGNLGANLGGNYAQYAIPDESVSQLITAISENPDAFSGLLNSERDPQELLNMIFKTAQKTSKTLSESRSALSRYFNNVNEAIDYLTKE